jgi:hypothetical protein
MVVFRVYFARSSAGVGVAVGASVSVGKGVLVAEGTADTVGVLVGAGARDVQDARVNIARNRIRMNGLILFRMGCILPLVAKFIELIDKNFE